MFLLRGSNVLTWWMCECESEFRHIGIRNKIWIFYLMFKRDATSTTFLQHFYNKLHVVSCYWFKFETNIKITFLPQQ